jgi:hypothetical protein
LQQLTDDEILLARLEKAVGKLPDDGVAAERCSLSPTALSPQIAPVQAHTWVEWMAARNLAAPNKGKPRKPAQTNGQISLWG